MRTSLILSAMLMLTTVFTSCKKDDDGPSSSCYSDQVSLTETEFDNYPDSHQFFVHFDAKNNSSSNYDISKGSKQMTLVFKVTATDGSVHEATQPFLLTELSAGSTSSTIANVDYGAGKTYQSYTVTLRCN